MMKKILIIFCVLLILCSCGNKKNEEPEINNDPEETIEPQDSEEQKDDEIKIILFKQEVKQNESWSLNGAGEYKSELNNKYLHIYGGNGEIDSSVLNSNPIILKEGDCDVSFTIISDIEETVRLTINEYLDEMLDVKEGSNEYNYSFYKRGASSVSTIVSFHLGDKSNEDHNIQINDFSIIANNKAISIRTNHIGYLNNLEKQAVFTLDQGNYYMICRVDDDSVVYRAPISEIYYDGDSKENLYKGFFKDFDLNGDYYIRGEFGGSSYNFKIGKDVYDDLQKDALKFLLIQRCGYELTPEEDEALYHQACHTAQAKLWTTLGDYYLDVTGGWHDAGDYGRYLQTSNKVLADLLITYLYADDNREELLDEIKWGLNWTFKLQSGDGSVYNKVTSKIFADFVLPENDNLELYVLLPWTCTTASFAGIMGLAYELFKDIDSAYAQKCLTAHENAISFLNDHKDPIYDENPEGFSSGYYSPANEADERLFAYIVAYRISGKDEYLKETKRIFDMGVYDDGLGYNFKLYSYVMALDTLTLNDDLYKKVKDDFKNECDGIADVITDHVYSYALQSYSQGSNQHECEAVNKLIFGYKFLKDERYLVKACESINYVLGMNTLDLSFVYGYGYNYPRTTHSRLANSKGTTIKGALASGVCESLTEGKMSQYFDSTVPISKRFYDVQENYCCIEPAIYYNSALILSLSFMEAANNDKLLSN